MFSQAPAVGPDRTHFTQVTFLRIEDERFRQLKAPRDCAALGSHRALTRPPRATRRLAMRHVLLLAVLGGAASLPLTGPAESAMLGRRGWPTTSPSDEQNGMKARARASASSRLRADAAAWSTRRRSRLSHDVGRPFVVEREGRHRPRTRTPCYGNYFKYNESQDTDAFKNRFRRRRARAEHPRWRRKRNVARDVDRRRLRAFERPTSGEREGGEVKNLDIPSRCRLRPRPAGAPDFFDASGDADRRPGRAGAEFARTGEAAEKGSPSRAPRERLSTSPRMFYPSRWRDPPSASCTEELEDLTRKAASDRP